MTKSPTYTSNYFELIPGKILDVQINHPVNVRFKTSLIGYELGNYIMLRHPNPEQADSYKDVLVAGNVVIVRYILEGTQGQCCAFKATIRHVAKHPEPLIFVDFPKQIENRELRLHQRFVTHLPASLLSVSGEELGKTKINGVISDISAKGCGFSFKSDNNRLKVNKTQILVQLMLTADKEILIPAQVCNSRFEQGKVSVGIQFKDADKQVRQILEHLLIGENY